MSEQRHRVFLVLSAWDWFALIYFGACIVGGCSLIAKAIEKLAAAL